MMNERAMNLARQFLGAAQGEMNGKAADMGMKGSGRMGTSKGMPMMMDDATRRLMMQAMMSRRS